MLDEVRGSEANLRWIIDTIPALVSSCEENTKLKRLVADLSLDRHILQEIVKKKLRGVREKLEAWRQDYNREHPNLALQLRFSFEICAPEMGAASWAWWACRHDDHAMM